MDGIEYVFGIFHIQTECQTKTITETTIPYLYISPNVRRLSTYFGFTLPIQTGHAVKETCNSEGKNRPKGFQNSSKPKNQIRQIRGLVIKL